uniref:Uncharacterized protein n=1 Tax=Meloidogyne enterolobii TaxID=390850 RepID=A0A6V7W8Y3_MELEN|nr:unnamed protein product [Meloidogyne enterolobii]
MKIMNLLLKDYSLFIEKLPRKSRNLRLYLDFSYNATKSCAPIPYPETTAP